MRFVPGRIPCWLEDHRRRRQTQDGPAVRLQREGLKMRAVMIITVTFIAIYRRQSGPPGSEPVGAPHHSTGLEG
ncbi:hypothetical protein [Microlunatus endophyticus]|nr:hypothetical protein [Microlunatus endophyticus]